jgi:hypothetical protein
MSTGLAVLTLLHAVISLIGIVSGLVVTFGLLRSERMDGWTAALHPLAPTGSEAPFLIAQTVVMIVFVALAILAAKNFRGDIVQAA